MATHMLHQRQLVPVFPAAYFTFPSRHSQSVSRSLTLSLFFLPFVSYLVPLSALCIYIFLASTICMWLPKCEWETTSSFILVLSCERQNLFCYPRPRVGTILVYRDYQHRPFFYSFTFIFINHYCCPEYLFIFCDRKDCHAQLVLHSSPHVHAD